MMVSDDFLKDVVAALERIVKSDADVARLGLTDDIAGGWRSYFYNYDIAQMAERVLRSASDNKIVLEGFENDQTKTYSERTQAAAEMFIGTVDGFYRRILSLPN